MNIEILGENMKIKTTFLAGIAVLFLVQTIYGQSANVADRQEVSQYGITWKFDKPVKSGRFITGDWWVIGPVNVVSVTPAQGPAPADDSMNIPKDGFGVSMLANDNQMRNGSMVLPDGEIMEQGYDSRGLGYDPSTSIKFPYNLDVDRSMISSESHKTLPNDNFCHKIMWTKEKKSNSPLKTVAVLTCLTEVPAEDAFRPAYAGKKTIYREKDLKYEKLLRLKPVGKEPEWDDFERYFQRVWLDKHSWSFNGVVPTENQVGYGREGARLGSMAGLLLNLDVPNEKKRNLLIGFVQRGIDLCGLVESGMIWSADGGHFSGRKWPILFAGIMLDNENMRNIVLTVPFQEDQQTYYGKGFFGQTVLWQIVHHTGHLPSYEEKSPEKWNAGDKKSEGYRNCCTSNAWIGTALTVRLMKGVKMWGHNAFFDYCDRWMAKDDPYKKARGKYERPSGEGATYDPWVDAMWEAYRKTAPQQEAADKSLNLKWKWFGEAGKWVPNE